MGRSQKPRRPYRPYVGSGRLTARLQPWKLDATFGPIELMLDRLERDGLLDITAAGTMSSVVVNRGEEAVAEALKGRAETFDIARGRSPSCPDTGALHRFADQLNGSGQMTLADVADCRRCVEALRQYAAVLPAAKMGDLVHTASIKFGMEDADERQLHEEKGDC